MGRCLGNANVLFTLGPFWWLLLPAKGLGQASGSLALGAKYEGVLEKSLNQDKYHFNTIFLKIQNNAKPQDEQNIKNFKWRQDPTLPRMTSLAHLTLIPLLHRPQQHLGLLPAPRCPICNQLQCPSVLPLSSLWHVSCVRPVSLDPRKTAVGSQLAPQFHSRSYLNSLLMLLPPLSIKAFTSYHHVPGQG